VKIRVLETLASLRRAGAERVAVTLAAGLDPERFETAVVTLYPASDGDFEPLLRERSIPLWRLGKRRGLDPRMWPRLAAIFRSFRPDIIHTHSFVLNYAFPAWVRTRQGRIVHTVHNLAEKENGAIGRVMHRAAFRFGALPVAISERVAASFERFYGFAPGATVPNGVDCASFQRPGRREAWRSENGFAPEDLLIVSVARLEPQKNPLRLIEAFAEASASAPAHLLMAGEGSLLDACRSAAARAGIAGRVRFLGPRQDIPELLAACDLFALASDWEGAPVALIEAMAAGLPVVATAVGGVPDLVADEAGGVLVPPGDTAALALALAALARDPVRRRQMGEAARRRAALFEARAMIDSYAALFERAAGEAKR
jgi:glycosyltransferase involved in cell wall biosynthesis